MNYTSIEFSACTGIVTQRESGLGPLPEMQCLEWHLCVYIDGNFVNLTRLSDTVLNEIKEYLDYVEFQNESLKEIERKKEQLVNKYFNNGKCNFFSENSET